MAEFGHKRVRASWAVAHGDDMVYRVPKAYARWSRRYADSYTVDGVCLISGNELVTFLEKMDEEA